MLRQESDEGSGEVAANLDANIFLLFALIQKFTEYYAGSQISVFVAFPFRFIVVMLCFFIFISS